MKALEESWPFVPELYLFHNRKKADRFIRRHFDKRPRFLDTGAQTWCENGLAVVLITTAPETAWHTDAALLCHEAYHVVSMHYRDYIGEESPSEEFVAYGVQVVAKALFEAHERWKAKKVRRGERVMGSAKVKTDNDNFASIEHERVMLEMTKDGDSPNCPRSWTWDMWFDGEHIDGTCEEASLHETVKDALRSLDGIIAEFEGMRDFLRAYDVFGKEPEVSE